MVKYELTQEADETLKSILQAIFARGSYAPTSRKELKAWGEILDKFEIKDADQNR